MLYNKVSQLYVYIYPHIPALSRLPPTLPIPPLWGLKSTELIALRWMDLESVIQSEVSQKEKNKYRMLTHIYGI